MPFIGCDIGSISAKVIVTDAHGAVVEAHYRRTHGQSGETVLALLREVLQRTPLKAVQGLAVTGSGGEPLCRALNGFFVNEIIAHGRAAATAVPGVRSVVEIGGEDAKLITLDPDSGAIRGFSMNTVCAAGTGSFLDQQAARLGVAIEEEFGRLACSSAHPPRIAGRCSVFAKSDMIHLQQIATPECDIVMGLCLAMARTFRSTVAHGADPPAPVVFQGGVAANSGMVRALETVFSLEPGGLIIPPHFAVQGALGAVLALIDHGSFQPMADPRALERLQAGPRTDAGAHSPLHDDGYAIQVKPAPVPDGAVVDAFLGVDVGSISTNLVVLDSDRRVIARRYLMTAGQPIEAVRRGLLEIGRDIANRVRIRGVAATGSGRYLTGDFIGADVVKNEITAHARGALHVDPAVDTIFEIGGQDSKYIRLENGAVVDFTMNKVCAAGTGSFLEEQAEKLGISIRDEFSSLAFQSAAPAALGERCTVFMESSLNRYQQQGTPRADLAAGLCYSIALNYLNRVVEKRSIGSRIFFQGGTAYNRGVKAAFEQLCGKKITVPPHHDVLGALGCAVIASEAAPPEGSRFRGFDLAHRSYQVESFECRHCANHCEIRRVSIDGEPPLHYGSRCGRYDEQQGRSAHRPRQPDLFALRERVLMDCEGDAPPGAPTVGMPRAGLFFELYPFWHAFFRELGFQLVPSPPTTRETVVRGCEAVVEDLCFPVKVAHGHILALLEAGVDWLFLPCTVNMPPENPAARTAYNCLYVQSLPYLARCAIDLSRYATRVLDPVLHFEWGPRVFTPQLRRLARSMGCGAAAAGRALQAGLQAQRRFREALACHGANALAQIDPGRPALVIVSRPYNGCDPGLNMRIPEKLRARGCQAIPLDFLPAATEADPGLQSMYWRYGQRIAAAGRTIAADPRLHGLYITNFSCGPDSFVMKYFEREMGDKPWLMIELDEHSADAGVTTRLEAFLDSIESAPHVRSPAPRPRQRGPERDSRTIYVPYMDDHGQALAAAMRHYGIAAEALPMADAESVTLGRRYTSGRECFPCIITTGDIVKKTRAPDFDPRRAAFFMPTADGPCRFGQYSGFHRQVLDELGLHEVPLVELDQTTSFQSALSNLGPGFRRRCWQAIVLIDALKKLLLQTRPYERRPGQSDAAYREALERVCRTVETGGSLRNSAALLARDLRDVSVDRSCPRPLIGLVGEIFVRSHSFSNNDIVRTIEALGGEVVMPTLQEWVQYTDWERRRDLRREQSWASLARELAAMAIQRRDAARIPAALLRRVRSFARELPTAAVLGLARTYLSAHVRGEAGLSLGRAEEYARHGCAGLVNVTPFGCMPGTIVNTLLQSFSKRYPELPVLKMVYDGSDQAGDRLRVEAFMYQTRQGR